jgi:hypothetical protein
MKSIVRSMIVVSCLASIAMLSGCGGGSAQPLPLLTIAPAALPNGTTLALSVALGCNAALLLEPADNGKAMKQAAVALQVSVLGRECDDLMPVQSAKAVYDQAPMVMRGV